MKQINPKPKILRPDNKGRITLGILAKDVSSFAVFVADDEKIILVPYVEIPAREKWLFSNKAALKKVKKGLQDSAEGKVHHHGSFQKFLTEDDLE